MGKINYIALDEYGKEIIEKIKNDQRYQETEKGLNCYEDTEILSIIIGNTFVEQNKDNSIYILKEDNNDDELASLILDILAGALIPGLIGTDLKDLIYISKENNIASFYKIEFNDDFSDYKEKIKELFKKPFHNCNMVAAICYKEDITLFQTNEIIQEMIKYQNIDTIFSCHKDSKNSLTLMILT